ncbi:DUF294 nucleotidyltransferase-like domain-containing protein [Candidatus Jidaibacter acanthamoebae]|nr:DUF294 nucleotidyltransferase-like domain-containing protein [Candidatus Jidaibacter acanthamoeba]
MSRNPNKTTKPNYSLSFKEEETLEQIVHSIDKIDDYHTLYALFNNAVRQNNEVKLKLFLASGIKIKERHKDNITIKKFLANERKPGNLVDNNLLQALQSDFDYLLDKEDGSNNEFNYVFKNISEKFKNKTLRNLAKAEIKQQIKFAEESQKGKLLELYGNLLLWQIYYGEVNTSDYRELFLPAAKLYNGAIMSNLTHGNPQQNNYIKDKLGLLEKKYIKLCFFKHRGAGSLEEFNYKNRIDIYLNRIKLIRESVAYMLNHNVVITVINQFICKSIKNLVKDIIVESEDYLGLSTSSICEYAIIGLGSMSRNEITTHSDLELMILKNKSPKSNDKYFEDLINLVQLKIINFGETRFTEQELITYGLSDKEEIPELLTLKNLFLEARSPTKRGISLDSSEITPLKTNLLHSFIGTPKELADVVIKFREYDFNSRIVSELVSFTYIHGSIKAPLLLEEYKDLIQKKFLTRKREEVLSRLKKDIEFFVPHLTYDENSGKLLMLAKHDIYRVFDRIIDGFALLEDVKKHTSGTERLNDLKVIKAYIEDTQEIEEAIRYFLALRLKTYLYYNAQKEDVYLEYGNSNFSGIEKQKDVYCLNKEQAKILLTHYQTIKIFYFQIKDYLYLKDINIFKDFGLHKHQSFAAIGDNYKKLHYYKIAESFYKDAEALSSMAKHKKENKLGNLYLTLGDYTKALEKFEEGLNEEENPVKQLKLNLAVAKCLLFTNQYKKALQHIENISKDKSIKDISNEKNFITLWTLRNEIYAIYQISESIPLKEVTETFNNKLNNKLYWLYESCSFLDKNIITYFKDINGVLGLQSLQVYYQKLLVEIKAESRCTAFKLLQAKLYYNLGAICQLIGENKDNYLKAKNYFKQAEIIYSKYKSKAAVKLQVTLEEDAACCLINVSCLYRDTYQYAKAIKYAYKALEYFEKLSKNIHHGIHYKLITIYELLRESYSALGNRSESSTYKIKIAELNYRINGRYEFGLNTLKEPLVSKHVENQPAHELGLRPAIWNIPDNAEYFTKREQLIDKITANLQNAESKVLVIAGLEGSGKSQIALYYANTNREKYKSMIRWLKANDDVVLEAEYRDFAKTLGINTEEKNITELIGLVRSELQVIPGLLLIFDGAQNYKSISSYIHKQSNIHILITSSNQNWGIWPSINIRRFEENEAIEYIFKIIEKASKEEVCLLTNKLGYFPLALAQAATFIKQNNYYLSIKEYLNIYKTCWNELMAQPVFPQDNYDKTIFSILNTSLKRIQDNIPALDLLRLCAYTHLDGIPYEFAESWFKMKDGLDEGIAKLKVCQAICLLKNYSLIEIDSNQFYAYTFFKKLIKARYKFENYEKEIIENLLVNLNDLSMIPDTYKPTSYPLTQADMGDTIKPFKIDKDEQEINLGVNRYITSSPTPVLNKLPNKRGFDELKQAGISRSRDHKINTPPLKKQNRTETPLQHPCVIEKTKKKAGIQF